MNIQKAPEHLPSRLIFELTEACNYKCVHCFVPRNVSQPTTEQAVHILSHAVKAGIPSISWTGGEPYLRKDLFKIAEDVASSGQTVHTINTNGSLITHDNAKTTSRYFSLARVSIFGTPSTYGGNSNCGDKFGYNTAINAIEHFLDNNVKVQINVPVLSTSVEHIHCIARDVEKRFADAVEEVVFIPVVKIGPLHGTQSVFLEKEEIASALKSIKSDVSYPIRQFVWEPGKHMVIKADCNAYAHPVDGVKDGALLIGSALKEDIAALWKRFPPEFVGAHRNLTPSVDHLKL